MCLTSSSFLTICVSWPLTHLSLVACPEHYSPSDLLLKNRFSPLAEWPRCLDMIPTQWRAVSFYQNPLVRLTKILLLSIFKFILKKSRPLSTHFHSPEVTDTLTIGKNNQINIWTLIDRLPIPHLFSILPLSGQKLFKRHLIQEILLVLRKAIYKLELLCRTWVTITALGYQFPSMKY